MGITHYSILNTHPDVRLTAVCDPQKALLNGLKKFKEIETFTDYRKLFSAARPDFAIVCTPTASHIEIGEAAAEQGTHVFMEKPFSLSLSEGTELVKVAENAGLVSQVGYFLRFHSVFNAVKQILDDGVIGAVSHYKNEMYGRTVLKPSKVSWRAKKKMGGGCMMDFGSHCLDLSDYFFGAVSEVRGSLLKSIYSAEVEDAFFTQLVHHDGIVGSISVNWSDESYRRPYNRIEILGEKGKVIVDRQEFRLYLREDDPRGRFEKGWNVRYLPELEKGARFIVRGPEFTEQLDHFIDAVKNKNPNTRCTFEDASRTDRVMDMIREEGVRC